LAERPTAFETLGRKSRRGPGEAARKGHLAPHSARNLLLILLGQLIFPFGGHNIRAGKLVKQRCPVEHIGPVACIDINNFWNCSPEKTALAHRQVRRSHSTATFCRLFLGENLVFEKLTFDLPVFPPQLWQGRCGRDVNWERVRLLPTHRRLLASGMGP